jgi:hypothetical protein
MESYSWTEGSIHIWTGNGATSAVVGLATTVDGNLTYGIVNRQVASGGYYDYQTGQRADVRLGALWTYDSTIRKLVASATALHMKVMNSSINGSAGYIYYSGRIDSLSFRGAENGLFSYDIAAHFNVFSGF